MKASVVVVGSIGGAPSGGSASGFSLPELLIATTIMLIISSTVTTGLLHMTNAQKTIFNRTELHAGVRSATEQLQQEVGQAGRITLPGPITVGATAAAGQTSLTLSSTSGIFVGEQLVVGAGTNSEETVRVLTVGSGAITATSSTPGTSVPSCTTGLCYAHSSPEPVRVYGGFSYGVVPCKSQADCPGSRFDPSMTNTADGSTGTLLKLFGDINGDGNMVYIEYHCDTSTDPGYLYRNMMAWDAASKPPETPSLILLSNIQANPDNTACFTYQQKSANNVQYVINVAITLTVQTQQKDAIDRGHYQKETKALLNVSPRNVFNVWELADQMSFLRVQPAPASGLTAPPSIALLLP